MMEDKKKKLKCVFNLYVASKLVNLGYKPMVVEPNMEDTRFLVFKFSATEEFLKDFEQIKASYLLSR